MTFSTDGIVFQPIGDAVIIPLQGSIDAKRIETLRQKLLDYIQIHKTKGVIFDFSGIEIMDADDMQGFKRIAKASELMGVPAVCTGLTDGLVAGLITVKADTDWVVVAPSVKDALRGIACKHKRS